MKREDRNTRAMPGEITARDVLSLPYYCARGVKYHVTDYLYTPKPKVLSFAVTRRCNSRCTMCSIWRTGNAKRELSVAEIRQTLGDPVFGSLETVIFGGGEPTQRHDLAEVVQTVLESNPGIKEIGLSTNGLEASTVIPRVREILELASYSQLNNFTLQVSLDGYGVTHEKIRRVDRAFQKVVATLNALKDLQSHLPFNPYSIRLNCVVQPLNISDLPRLSRFAWEQGLPMYFVPAYSSGFHNVDPEEEHLTLSGAQLEELRAFLDLPSQHTLSLTNLAFWRDYFHIIRGERRRVPCALARYAVALDADGTLFICGKHESLIYGNVRDSSPEELWFSAKADQLRKLARRSICPHCDASCLAGYAISREFFYFARFLVKEKLLKRVARPPRRVER
jgi:MoaA/NifB/PqqE/SkfB family radical SAM enzyme